MKRPVITMAKLLTAILAVAGIGLATAGTASADEAGFIAAIDSLDHYAIECAGCAQDAVDVGYRACAAFNRGGDQAAIRAVLDSYNADTEGSRNYYATLFAQYAAYQLCPEHNGEIGPI